MVVGILEFCLWSWADQCQTTIEKTGGDIVGWSTLDINTIRCKLNVLEVTGLHMRPKVLGTHFRGVPHKDEMVVQCF